MFPKVKLLKEQTEHINKVKGKQFKYSASMAVLPNRVVVQPMLAQAVRLKVLPAIWRGSDTPGFGHSSFKYSGDRPISHLMCLLGCLVD